jgi:hypothetical protein
MTPAVVVAHSTEVLRSSTRFALHTSRFLDLVGVSISTDRAHQNYEP